MVQLPVFFPRLRRSNKDGPAAQKMVLNDGGTTTS
jgi:hypothetical protein